MTKYSKWKMEYSKISRVTEMKTKIVFDVVHRRVKDNCYEGDLQNHTLDISSFQIYGMK